MRPCVGLAVAVSALAWLASPVDACGCDVTAWCETMQDYTMCAINAQTLRDFEQAEETCPEGCPEVIAAYFAHACWEQEVDCNPYWTVPEKVHADEIARWEGLGCPVHEESCDKGGGSSKGRSAQVGIIFLVLFVLVIGGYGTHRYFGSASNANPSQGSQMPRAQVHPVEPPIIEREGFGAGVELGDMGAPDDDDDVGGGSKQPADQPSDAELQQKQERLYDMLQAGLITQQQFENSMRKTQGLGVQGSIRGAASPFGTQSVMSYSVSGSQAGTPQPAMFASVPGSAHGSQYGNGSQYSSQYGNGSQHPSQRPSMFASPQPSGQQGHNTARF